MPDEAFEEFWVMRGGKEMVALHALFPGASLPLEQVRETLGLTQDQLRAAASAARGLGLLEGDEAHLTFFALPLDSSQRARLDWCLESHTEEMGFLLTKLRGQMLLRFLSTPPNA